MPIFMSILNLEYMGRPTTKQAIRDTTNTTKIKKEMSYRSKQVYWIIAGISGFLGLLIIAITGTKFIKRRKNHINQNSQGIACDRAPILSTGAGCKKM